MQVRGTHLKASTETRLYAAPHGHVAALKASPRLVHLLDGASGAVARIWRMPSAVTAAGGNEETALAVACQDGSIWVWSGGAKSAEALSKRQRVDDDSAPQAAEPLNGGPCAVTDATSDVSLQCARAATGTSILFAAPAGPDSLDCFFACADAPCDVQVCLEGETLVVASVARPIATVVRVVAARACRPLMERILGARYVAERGCLLVGHDDGSVSAALEGQSSQDASLFPPLLPGCGSPCILIELVRLDCAAQEEYTGPTQCNACIVVTGNGVVNVLLASSTKQYTLDAAVDSCTIHASLLLTCSKLGALAHAYGSLPARVMPTRVLSLQPSCGVAALRTSGCIWSITTRGALQGIVGQDPAATLAPYLGRFGSMSLPEAVQAIVDLSSKQAEADAAHALADQWLKELNASIRILSNAGCVNAQCSAVIEPSGSIGIRIILSNGTTTAISSRWTLLVELAPEHATHEPTKWTFALRRGLASHSKAQIDIHGVVLHSARPHLCAVWLLHESPEFASLLPHPRRPLVRPPHLFRMRLAVHTFSVLDWLYRPNNVGLHRVILPAEWGAHVHASAAPAMPRLFRFTVREDVLPLVVAEEGETVSGGHFSVQIRGNDDVILSVPDGSEGFALRAAWIRRIEVFLAASSAKRNAPADVKRHHQALSVKASKKIASKCQQLKASYEKMPPNSDMTTLVKQIVALYNEMRTQPTHLY